MNSKLILSALVTLATTSQALAASCDFKLIESVPVARVTLKPGAKFAHDSLLNLTFDPSKVVKEEKLNGNLFKGSYAGLEGIDSGEVALYVDEIERASGHLDFGKKCTRPVFNDGYCNVATAQTSLEYAKIPSLDKETFDPSVKDPSVGYFFTTQINPKTGAARIIVASMSETQLGMIDGGNSTLRIILAPGQSSANLEIVSSFTGEAGFYNVGNGGSGPRTSHVEVSCKN